jgi:hypothetical protein
MKRQDITDALRIITVVVLAFIAIYLVKVNDELQGIRQEQVKNNLYGLSPEAKNKINAASNAEVRRRRLESSTSVDVDNATPISVEIQNEPLQVEGTVTLER